MATDNAVIRRMFSKVWAQGGPQHKGKLSPLQQVPTLLPEQGALLDVLQRLSSRRWGTSKSLLPY